MPNETTISPTTEMAEEEAPYWMIIIWCVAGFLVVVIVIVAIYYSVVHCCWRKNRRKERSRASRINEGNPLYNYPQGLINHLHHDDANAPATFSPSFVDNMRIPRAMEVKIVESVNSINHSYPTHPYSSPSLSPKGGDDYLSTEMLSSPKERVAPSRQQSFRYSNMSTEESKERIHREKMLVTELREKFRNQRNINE